MSLGLVILIVLIVLLLGSAPAWPYSRGWSYYPSGTLGTVLLNAVTVFLPIVKNFYLDVLIRVVRTFLVTVLGAATADQFDLFQATGWRLTFIAAGSAVLVVIKSALAQKFVANTITPASLAKSRIE